MIGKTIRNLIVRANNSAVVFTWILSGLRIGQGLIVLPLLGHFLAKPDFGMYYVLLGLSALIPVLDFGFSAALGRNISYAMAGATELKAEGVSAVSHGSGTNFNLLWELLHAMRLLYRRLALVAFVAISIIGTLVVNLHVQQTSSIPVTWVAWFITLVAVVWELYSGWWRVFLQGMNEVVPAGRIAVFGSILNISIASILLIGRAGLLSVPIASLIASFVQRHLARRACLQILGTGPASLDRQKISNVFHAIWPNAWKFGLQLASAYLIGRLIIFLKVFDLSDNADYGLSAQLVSVIQGISTAWTTVKWPLVSQLRVQGNYEHMRRLLWPRVWMQGVTYLVLALGLVSLAQPLLIVIGTNKRVLPMLWLSLLTLNGYLEMRLSFWGMLISTENRLPYVFPVIATNICSVLIAVALLHFTALKFGALVLAPLVAGTIFNYWYWPLVAAHTLKSSWFRFVFLKQKSE
jgi:hypothetical protein